MKKPRKPSPNACAANCSVPSEDEVRKHAEQAGFPANEIMEVRAIIDPTTAEV